MTTAPYRDDLNKIVILNPKGGCGKTTLATNLASYFALRGPTPTLIDCDPKGFTERWLERRPPDSPKINGIASRDYVTHGNRSWPFRTPKESGAVIVDTPAGLGPREFAELSRFANCILVPVLPSAFDVQVTTNFIAEFLLLTDFELPIGVVANRTRQNTKSLAMLMRILANLETPTIAVLRDSQNFVHAAAQGLGVHEMPHFKVQREVEQMDLIIDWLDEQLIMTTDPRFGSLVGLSRPLRGRLAN
jgi:chromosome partitioning protein